MNKKTAVKLITFGRGGHTFELSAHSKLSGYDTPERVEGELAAGRYDDNYDIPDGTPAVDKVPAINQPGGVAAVFKSPLVNVDLDEGDIERFNLPKNSIIGDAVQNGLMGPVAQASVALALVAKGKPEPGPLDEVSIDVYLTYWRRKGARIGALWTSPDGTRRFDWDPPDPSWTPRDDAPADDGSTQTTLFSEDD